MEKLIMLSQAAINLLIHNEYATSWLVMSSRFNNQDEDDDGETNKRSLQSLDSDFGVASCLGFFIDQQNLATLTVHLIYLSMNINNLVLSIVGSFGGRNLDGMIYKNEPLGGKKINLPRQFSTKPIETKCPVLSFDY